VTSATLETAGGPSLVVGLIAAGLLGPVIAMVSFVLMITVVGWALVPVVLGVAGAVLVFGLVIASLWVGRRVYDTAHSGPLDKIPPLMFQMLLGLAVLLLCVAVPAALLPGWIGMLLLGLLYVAACIGLGAAILSRFGTLAPPGLTSRGPYTDQHYGAGPTSPLGPLPKRGAN
jgi:hypothetical protein